MSEKIFLNTHSEPFLYSPPNPETTCVICKKTFSKPQNLMTHILTVHSATYITCDVCSKTFSTKGALTRHQRTSCFNSKPETHTCEHCSKTFTTSSNLLKHQRLNCIALNFCSKCGETIKHSNENDKDIFYCSFCSETALIH